MENKLEDIELRSEAVQDILTRPPHWMVRYGISVLFFILVMIVVLSFFIKYPDVITAKAIITSENPPERIETKTSSRLVKLYVKNGQKVQKGELLAVLESSANYQDILQLKKLTDSIKVNYSSFYFPFSQLKNLQLGDVQSAFIALHKSYTEYTLNQQLHPYAHEITSGMTSQSENSMRLKGLIQQQQIEASKLTLAQQQYNRATRLYNEGIISTYELEKEKVAYLQAKQNYDQTHQQISQQRDAVNQTQKQIKATQITQHKTDVTHISSTYQALDELKKSLKVWEQNYLLLSSYPGIIKFQNSWKENALIKSGELFATILPEYQSQFIGNLTLPAQNSGKVKSGQKVLVKLDNYPYQEYGMIEGRVQTMSSVPDKEGNYFVEISLPNGLKTQYGKNPPFDKELTGTAEIITEDLSLIERIFYQFRKLVIH